MSVSYASSRLSIPSGFEYLLESLAREVLREQPEDIIAFAADYFRTKLIIRDEGGITDTPFHEETSEDKGNEASPEVEPVGELDATVKESPTNDAEISESAEDTGNEVEASPSGDTEEEPVEDATLSPQPEGEPLQSANEEVAQDEGENVLPEDLPPSDQDQTTDAGAEGSSDETKDEGEAPLEGEREVGARSTDQAHETSEEDTKDTSKAEDDQLVPESELEGVESEGENPAAVEGSNMEDTSGQEDHPQDEVTNQLSELEQENGNANSSTTSLEGESVVAPDNTEPESTGEARGSAPDEQPSDQPGSEDLLTDNDHVS